MTIDYAMSPVVLSKLKPLYDTVIVSDMHFDERISQGGIVILNDDMKNSGIRPRWARVYAIGPEQQDVRVGQWVLVEHGRWSRGLKIIRDGEEITIRRADPEAIIFVSNDQPDSIDTISTAVHAERKTREQYE